MKKFLYISITIIAIAQFLQIGAMESGFSLDTLLSQNNNVDIEKYLRSMANYNVIQKEFEKDGQSFAQKILQKDVTWIDDFLNAFTKITYISIVKNLLDATDKSNNTLLNYAINAEKIDVVRIFIKNGAKKPANYIDGKNFELNAALAGKTVGEFYPLPSFQLNQKFQKNDLIGILHPQHITPYLDSINKETLPKDSSTELKNFFYELCSDRF